MTATGHLEARNIIYIEITDSWMGRQHVEVLLLKN